MNLLARYRQILPNDDRPDDPAWVIRCTDQYLAMQYNRPTGKKHLSTTTWQILRREKLTPDKPDAAFVVTAFTDHLRLTYNAVQLEIGPGTWIGASSIGTVLRKCSWQAVAAACDHNDRLGLFLSAADLLAAQTAPDAAVEEAEKKAAGLFFGEACQRVQVLEKFRENRIIVEKGRKALSTVLTSARIRRNVTVLKESDSDAHVRNMQ